MQLAGLLGSMPVVTAVCCMLFFMLCIHVEYNGGGWPVAACTELCLQRGCDVDLLATSAVSCRICWWRLCSAISCWLNGSWLPAIALLLATHASHPLTRWEAARSSALLHFQANCRHPS
jgi:hypothetical protein